MFVSPAVLTQWRGAGIGRMQEIDRRRDVPKQRDTNIFLPPARAQPRLEEPRVHTHATSSFECARCQVSPAPTN